MIGDQDPVEFAGRPSKYKFPLRVNESYYLRGIPLIFHTAMEPFVSPMIQSAGMGVGPQGHIDIIDKTF